MTKRSERSVRELYDRTETIDEPEMTPVLEGSCRVQGPTELPKDLQRMKSGNTSAQQRNMFCSDTRAETGTCNVCSAPCSSCMHRIAMESNVDCEFSDNIGRKKETDICSVVDSKSRESSGLQHADSEASNLLTASSSHNSVSDNTESKATFQDTITHATSETVKMPVSSLMVEKLGQAPIRPINRAVADKESHDNPMLLVHQTALHKQESDCYGDSKSCISGARDECVLNLDQTVDMDRKEMSSNLTSRYNMSGNASEKVNEIHNSIVTGHNESNKLAKFLAADPVDLETCRPKYDVSEECKTVSDTPRLLKEEDQCSKLGAGLDGCDEAIGSESTNTQPEAHISGNDEPHLLICHMEAHTVAESQACESEVLVDVNVCDICGDVGKEASLATCSRCLDGAEHIYCMRIKLNNLPDGDWLCEECQMKEESEKKRLAKLEAVSRPIKADPLGKKIQNSGISLDHKNCPKSDLKSTDPKICYPSESMKCPKKLDNKHMIHSHKDITSSALKNVSQNSHVSTSPKKGASPAPESFSKNFNLAKVKSSEIALSPGRVSAHKLQASSHSKPLSSNVTKFERELGAPKKLLQKQFSSNSLSITSKPKQLLKTRSHVFSRESASVNIRKEGKIGTLSRSASFKSVSPGNYSIKSASKSPILKSPRVEDSRGFKSMKEGSIIEKKKSFVLERPFAKSLAISVKPVPEVDVKLGSHAGNSNNMSENIVSTGKISEGTKEICAAPKSKSEKITDIENKKLVNAVKGIVRANSSVAINTLKNDGVLMTKSSDAPSFGFKNDKDMDSLASGSRQLITVKDGPLHSHRFKELNSARASSGEDKMNVVSLKPSAKVNFKKRVRCKDAVETAFDENTQKKTKYFEQSEEHKVSNNATIAQVPAKSLLSKIHDKTMPSEAISNGDKGVGNTDPAPGKGENTKFEQSEEHKVSNNTTTTEVPAKSLLSKIHDKTMPSEAISNGDKGVGNTDPAPGKGENTKFEQSEEHKVSNNTTTTEVPSKSSFSSKIHDQTFPSEAKSDGDEGLGKIDAASAKREGPKVKQFVFDLNTTLTDPDEPITETSFQCMLHCASLLSGSLGAHSFPQHDFIWRGDFEILRSGRCPEIVGGIQAHMSFSASPKVPWVAGRFPSKIQLVEVPRASSWPLQFEETSPTAENIALYFFAKDFESYEKSYQTLLDDMLKSDLALVGSIDEVDLLIFPSNMLPEASQRWNTLFFLWGVFRGRKPDSSKLHADLLEKSTGFELTNDTLVQEPVSFQKISSADFPIQRFSGNCKSVKMEESNDILKIEEFPIEKASGEDVGTVSSQLIASHSCHMNGLHRSLGSSKSPVKPSLNSLEQNGQRACAAMIGDGTFLENSSNIDVKKGYHIKTHDYESANEPFTRLSVTSESREGNRSMHIEEKTAKIPLKSEIEQVVPAVMETDNMNWNSRKKRPLDLCSLPLRAEESKVFQDSTHFAIREDDRTCKRMKCSSDRHNTNSYRDVDGDSKLTTSKINLFSGVCLEGQLQSEDSNPREWIAGKLNISEHWNSPPINFIGVSSDDDDCPSFATIDLNLAIGPNKRLPKEISVSQINSDIKGKQPSSSMDSMENISDALSLALPLRKQMQNSIKAENIFPEKPDSSTSLSLFWGGT